MGHRSAPLETAHARRADIDLTMTPDRSSSVFGHDRARARDRWVDDLQVDARSLRLPVLAAVAIGVGVGVAVDPVRGGAVVLVATVAMALLLLGARITDLFLGLIAVMLIGYAFLGRGFAYLGVPPLFVGELGLVLGGAALLRGKRYGPIQATHALLVAFMVLGALQTIPYIGRFGVDALRDAVTWVYAAFAIIVSFIMAPRHLAAGIDVYRRTIPLYLLWIPIVTAIGLLVEFPTLPGTTVEIVSLKGGDIGVMLAGIGAFILVGLYAAGHARRLPEVAVWALWLVNFALVGVLNRGGLLAAAMIAAVVLYVRAAGRILTATFVAIALLTVVVAIDPKIPTPARVISVGQIVENLTSLVGESDDPGLEGTKEFRIKWWSTIVDYTVAGPYFWTGKGFGINLADADGFQPTADGSLRAPHNGHMEILARTGVPGLVLWVLLQATYGFSLFRAGVRARGRQDEFSVQVLGFAFVFWLAALVNASFDPFLQGPHGGIWFWVMMGVGLAAIRMADRGDFLRAGGDVADAGEEAGRNAYPAGSSGAVTPASDGR